LIVGFGFMEHGYPKIVRGPEHFGESWRPWAFLGPI